VGSELGTTYFLVLIADAQRAAGLIDAAWLSLDEADEAARRTHEGWWAPELHRIRGELLRMRGAPDAEVEHELVRGLELAQQRGSHSLSGRVATTLAQHFLERGRSEERRVGKEGRARWGAG